MSQQKVVRCNGCGRLIDKTGDPTRYGRKNLSCVSYCNDCRIRICKEIQNQEETK